MPANPVFRQSNPLPLPFAMGSRSLPALRLPSLTITPSLPIRAAFFKYSEKITLFSAHPSLMVSCPQMPIARQQESPLHWAQWLGARDGPYPAMAHQVVLKACRWLSSAGSWGRLSETAQRPHFVEMGEFGDQVAVSSGRSTPKFSACRFCRCC